MLWGTIISFGMRALPFLKSPKVVASIAGLAGAALLWWYVGNLKDNLQEARDQSALFKSWYQIAADKNADLAADMRTCSAANAALAESVRVSEEERIAAVAEAVARAARAEMQLDDTLDTLEEARNETPDCQELSEIDMGAVCPAVVERLREHATGTFDRN